MKMQNDYDLIYEYYNLIMNFVPYREWASYIVKQFYAHNGKGNRIADLGAGTCKLSLLLEKKGFDIIAIDISFNMIKQLFENNEVYKNIFPIVADMSYIPLKGNFNLIICIYDTVNHLDHNSFYKALKNIFSILDKHGILMFDFNTHFGLSVFQSGTFKRKNNNIVSVWNTYFNRETNICTLKLNIYSDNHLIKSGVFNERALSKEYVEQMIIEAGFDQVYIYDFLEYKLLNKNSQRGFAVCIKK